MLYGHGDDAYRLQTTIKANFSSNVYFGGAPKGLSDVLSESLTKNISMYPEVLAESLQEKIAEHHNLEPKQVLVCNGAIEAIYLIAHLFSKSKTTIFIPTFSEYEDACRIFEHQLAFIEHDILGSTEEIPKLKTDLCFLCNPNNPTGNMLSKHHLLELVEKNDQTVFVVDEAFINFTLQPQENMISEVLNYKNLIVLRSMTKLFAIPSLRLGYAISNQTHIEKLKAFKQPWSVNNVAITAGKYILDHYQAILPDIPVLLEQTNRLMTQLKTLQGLRIGDSDVHFLLCELPELKASELKRYLVERHGILIREASNFRGCHQGHFRLATQTDFQNQQLVWALAEWMKTT